MNKQSSLAILAAILALGMSGCTSTTETVTMGPLTDSCTDGNCVDTLAGQQLGTCDAGDRVALNGFISVCPDTSKALNAPAPTPAPAPTAIAAQITVQNADALGVNSVEVRTQAGAPVAVNYSNSSTASIAFTNPATAVSLDTVKIEKTGDHAVITVPNADQIKVSMPSSMQQ